MEPGACSLFRHLMLNTRFRAATPAKMSLALSMTARSLGCLRPWLRRLRPSLRRSSQMARRQRLMTGPLTTSIVMTARTSRHLLPFTRAPAPKTPITRTAVRSTCKLTPVLSGGYRRLAPPSEPTAQRRCPGTTLSSGTMALVSSSYDSESDKEGVSEAVLAKPCVLAHAQGEHRVRTRRTR